jgi:ATP-binding cassette subfamily B protein
LTVKFLGQQIYVRFEKIQEFFSGITARSQENLTGVRVIRAYAQEESEIAEFEKLNIEYAGKNISLVKFAAAMRPLLFFFIGLSFVIIVAVGVPMAVRGEITAGEFTSFILYLQRMIWYLIALGYVVNLYQRGTASLKRFNAILENEPTIKDDEDVKKQPKIKGKIEFRNLNFAYNGTPVLKDINLTIEPGQTVAFVGKTGSGKSTLVSLVPRLMNSPDNTVFVDGIPVRKFPLEQLRRSVGFVQQETFLFSNTLESNILFGVESEESRVERKEISNGNNSSLTTHHLPLTTSTLSVEKAAAIAGMTDDIRGFPNGYQQLVGERGITLSGGQKQRTAIARAVMREPRILILDDSLSAVDTLTEEKILNGLRDVREGRTTLIVSHRISTIKDADLICVMQEGEIIERGTHEELLNLNGEYAELYERQLLEEEIEATD